MKSTASLFVMMLGFAIFPASMLSGGKLSELYGLVPSFMLIVFGNLILASYAGTLGYIGVRSRCNTHQLVASTFGVHWGRVIALLLASTQVGWFGVGIAFFAQTIEAIVPISHGWIILFATIIMSSSAIVGIRGMVMVSTFAVPLICVFIAWGLMPAFNSELSLASAQPIAELSTSQWLNGLFIVIGSFISGATFTPDYMQTAQSPKKAYWIAFFAFLFGNSFMFLAGLHGAWLTGEPDLVQVLMQQGFSMLALALLALSIWTTSDNSLYTASLALSQFTTIPRRYAVVIAAIIGALLSDWLYTHIIHWLQYLSLLIPPLGLILIVKYFIRSGILPSSQT